MNMSWKIIASTGVVAGLALGGFSLVASADETPPDVAPVLVDDPSLSPAPTVDDAAVTPVTTEVLPVAPEPVAVPDDGTSAGQAPTAPAPATDDVDELDDAQRPVPPAPAPVPAPDRGDDGPGDDGPERSDDGPDTDDGPESEDGDSDD